MKPAHITFFIHIKCESSTYDLLFYISVHTNKRHYILYSTSLYLVILWSHLTENVCDLNLTENVLYLHQWIWLDDDIVNGFWYYTSVPSGKACPKLLEDNFPPRPLIPMWFPDTNEEEDGPLDDNKLVWLVWVTKESPLLLTPADPPDACNVMRGKFSLYGIRMMFTKCVQIFTYV